MQSTVCRGCRRPSIDEKNGRNIFDDDSLIKSIDHDGSYNNKWFMKLSTGIELITGQKVTKEGKLPQKLCEICFENVEAFINFRYQLLRSRDILLGTVYQDSKEETDTKSAEAENSLLLNIPTSKAGLKETEEKLPGLDVFQTELSSSSLMSKTVIHTPLTKTIFEDPINVDDSSNTSLDVNSLPNEDGETNDSINCRLQNDQENNNLNQSDNSIDDPIITSVEEIGVKQPDHDIESEIDVCSGEDDDVLELDVQKMKNETVEINSSSESDIEVCDYEPTGKRGNYNTLTPPIRF